MQYAQVQLAVAGRSEHPSDSSPMDIGWVKGVEGKGKDGKGGKNKGKKGKDGGKKGSDKKGANISMRSGSMANTTISASTATRARTAGPHRTKKLEKLQA